MGIETITRQITSTNHSGLAAVNRAQLIKIRNQGLRDCFKHLDDIPQKMEFVARIQDKCFVDDAASCNVNATWYALESTEGPIIWIANGSSDSIDYRKLKTCVSQKVKMILCVGEHAESLINRFNLERIFASSATPPISITFREILSIICGSSSIISHLQLVIGFV